jgi:branched-chain amino acid aminotransferase
MGEAIVYVNNAFVPESEARISVMDHAFLYGDGVFDTAVAWKKRVFELDAHVDRFFRSMAAIAMESPVTRGQLKDLILEALQRSQLDNAYIKWIGTRGSNGTPLMDPTGCVANLVILTRPYIDRDAPNGLRVKTVAVRRPAGHVLDPQIKSLNYLNLVLAKIEAKAAGADQALMLDVSGRVCEAPGFNVFVVNSTVLRTPARDILRGVTREVVMGFAPALGCLAQQCDLELYDAYIADEIFLTSTAGGLIPVVELDGRRIGDGKPGPTYRALVGAYRDALNSSR